jgi:uncharacterized protein (DUF736 family)
MWHNNTEWRGIMVDFKADKLGAAWVKISSKGNEYLSGKFEYEGKKIPFIAFLKHKKEGQERWPDWEFFHDHPKEDKPPEDVF